MKVNQAEIVISAVSEKQYPQEQYRVCAGWPFKCREIFLNQQAD